MEPSTPLLTIGIPTFERRESLVRLLEGLERQRASLDASRIEVIVADNASRDGTEVLGTRMAAAGSIRYLRNATNLGFEGNIRVLLGAARGEYLWLMGDDDEVADGFLPELVGFLGRRLADLFIVPDRRAGEAETSNLAARFGIRSGVSAPLRDFLGEFGLFGILGGIGHAVFRRAELSGLEIYLPLQTRFPHVFLLAHSFADRKAVFLPGTGFLVPKMTPEQGEIYRARWDAEGLWVDGWLNCMRATLRLFEEGRIPTPVKPTFFRMMSDQDWPFHYHVYNALAQRIFVENVDIDEQMWSSLAKLDALLGWPSYSSRLNTLFHAALARRSLAESCLGLVNRPEGIFRV
ncbi:MAG: glycosyltransferase family 2 protein [Myxococcota bacterium]